MHCPPSRWSIVTRSYRPRDAEKLAGSLTAQGIDLIAVCANLQLGHGRGVDLVTAIGATVLGKAADIGISLPSATRAFEPIVNEAVTMLAMDPDNWNVFGQIEDGEDLLKPLRGEDNFLRRSHAQDLLHISGRRTHRFLIQGPGADVVSCNRIVDAASAAGFPSFRGLDAHAIAKHVAAGTNGPLFFAERQ